LSHRHTDYPAGHCWWGPAARPSISLYVRPYHPRTAK